MTLSEFLLARIEEDEAAARLCAEMFPAPWEVADRGWRVRIYASDVMIEDFGSDDPNATTTRNPVVMEVEPDRHIEDPRWLSERVEHVRRHDPARVLAECEAKRRIVEEVGGWQHETVEDCWYSCAATYGTGVENACCNNGAGTDCDCGRDYRVARVLGPLATVYADHPDYREEWKP